VTLLVAVEYGNEHVGLPLFVGVFVRGRGSLMHETIYRRSAAFAAGLRHRERLILGLMPAVAAFVCAVNQIATPDWKFTLVAFPLLLVMGELCVVFVLWTAKRLHLSGVDLELMLNDDSLTMRRPGFLNTIPFRTIGAVRGRTESNGVMGHVEIFCGRKISRLSGFDNMQEIYDRLALAAGGRAFVVTATPRRVFGMRVGLGAWGALLVAVFIVRKLWSGWSFPAEIAYQLFPVAVGVWVLGWRPFTQGGLLAKKRFETVIGVMSVVAGLANMFVAWQQKPLEQTLFVEGRVIRSPQLGLELEFPLPWVAVHIDGAAIPPTVPTYAPKMVENAFVVLRNEQRGCGLMLMATKSDLDEVDFDAGLRVMKTDPTKVRISQVGETSISGFPLRTAVMELNEPPIVGTARMSLGQKNRYLLWTMCMVPPGHDADLVECDRLFDRVKWTN
jgi:hypothetical protein